MTGVEDLRSCPSQKRVFATREDALQERRETRAAAKVTLYAYRCERCDQWHLSSRTSKQERRLGRRREDGKVKRQVSRARAELDLTDETEDEREG